MTTLVIQVNQQDLTASAHRIAAAAATIADLAQRVSVARAVLVPAGWRGRGAEAFGSAVDDEVLPALTRLHAVLESGSLTLREIGTVLYEAEQQAAALFTGTPGSSTFDDPPTRDTQGLARPSIVDAPAPSDTDLLFDGAAFAMTGITTLIPWLLRHRTLTREVLREFGRQLNALTGVRGHVGIMDDVHRALFGAGQAGNRTLRILENPLTKRALGALDFALGVSEDLTNERYKLADGEIDYTKTVGVNAAKIGISTAIGMSGVGTAILATNTIAQFGLGLGIEGMQGINGLVANDSNRAILDADTARAAVALDRADLDHVITAVGELGYDVVTLNTANIGRSLVNVPRTALDVVDGIGDSAVAFVTSGVNTTLAAATAGTSALIAHHPAFNEPMRAVAQQALTGTSTWLMQQTSNAAQSLTDETSIPSIDQLFGGERR